MYFCLVKNVESIYKIVGQFKYLIYLKYSIQ